jgi:prepilin-type N-terminal cleavage/methylation domain-containing protein
MQRNSSRNGFTLIELLVVITIIAILASIAFPVYSGVQEKAKVVQDMSNLRQIGLATQMYLNDNDGVCFLPTENWMKLLHPKYLAAWKIFQSPFDNKRAPSENESNAPVSYGLNDNTLSTPGGTNGLSLDKIVKASNYIVFAPSQTSTSPYFAGKSGDGSGVQVNKNSAGQYGTNAGGTHSRGQRINACMADIHVENMLWKDFHDDTPDPTASPVPSGSYRWHPF